MSGDGGVSSELAAILGVTCVLYVVVMFVISWFARGKIHDTTDYLVAGRRLPLSLACATLFATWFGAGAMLTATDEVRLGGLQRAALDPFGAGTCLVLAGLFFALPLWNMKLLTLGDFFRRRFGGRAEVLFGVLMVPSYFGWIAAQFVALAGVLELFFGLEPWIGIVLVAVVGTTYTLMGGMWSVTLTDAVQVVLVILGLIVLAAVTLAELGSGSVGDGLGRLWAETPTEMKTVIPTDTARALVGWIGVFAIGALGNIPGQDLMQRVFSCKSGEVARTACIVGGVSYIAFGLVPLVIGLAGNLLAPGHDTQAILPFIAQRFLSPPVAVIFLLAIMSAVLSTIDSAILSPASVLAQNVLTHVPHGKIASLQLNEVAVVFVAACSLGMAFAGESAYSLLEVAYELSLVALLVPLTLGLYWRRRGSEASAMASMSSGTALWLVHLAVGWEDFVEPLGLGVPKGLGCAAVSLAVYAAVAAMTPAVETSAQTETVGAEVS